MFNDEYKYAGRQDFEAEHEGIATLCDVKTGAIDKISHFKQLAAYAKCPKNAHIKQLMLIPLTNKTQQGFSKSIVTKEIERYWELFVSDRNNFKVRFGI